MPSSPVSPGVSPSDDETLAGLVSRIDPLDRQTSTLDAHKAFSADPALYALAVVDADLRPVGVLNRFKFLELLSRPFGRDLLTHRSVDTVMDTAPLVVDERMPLNQLSDILVDDGTKYIFDGFIVTRHGRYLGIGTGYSLMRRLTERKLDALFHLAYHDVLTGLPNRQLFNDRLKQALAHAKRNGRLLAVLFLDVDRFKAVNDNLGHSGGDALLRSIAARLKSVTRAQDTVARLSGDEFALVLTELGVPEHGQLVAGKLLEALRAPHVLDGHEINVSCSIGIAVYPADARDEESLVRAADDAAYRAKQNRNTWHRYSADVRHSPKAFIAFSAVQRAIDEHQLEVHYQPQIRAGTRTLHGVEALVRWRDPVRGVMPTLEFIRAAEDAGLIMAVTDYVLGSAMRQVLEWRGKDGRLDIHLSVNVSGVQMWDRTLIPVAERHLRETGFPASALELEITEATVMRSASSTIDVLVALRQLGIRLAVDDFGTGYSSLSRLQRLPVDALKIDKSFVHGIEIEGDGGALARAIIVMAHSLGLGVTAEGVETEKQAAFLESHGCDRMQGYFFGYPCSPQELLTTAVSFIPTEATVPSVNR